MQFDLENARVSIMAGVLAIFLNKSSGFPQLIKKLKLNITCIISNQDNDEDKHLKLRIKITLANDIRSCKKNDYITK